MFASSIPRRRATALVAAVLVVAAASNLISMPGTSGAATATVYTATVTGTEARSLTPHIQPRLISNTGGGVYPENEGTVEVGPNYIEVALNLPANAKVTSVSVIQQTCSFDDLDRTFSFGSYGPAGGNFVNYATFTPASPPGTSCLKSTLTKTSSPLATVAAVRRYVIDWELGSSGLAYVRTPDPTTKPMFIGAQVKYTCTAPCVP